MFPGLLRIQVERLMTSVIALVITVDWLRCEANCQTLLGVRVSLRTSAPISAMYTSIHTAGEANSKTLILMFLAPLSNKSFICKLKYFLDKSTASKVSSSFTISRNEFILRRWRTSFIMRSTNLLHSRLISSSSTIYTGVFYLDFSRHDIQIDKTLRLFPDRTTSSPPSNA